jgi:hypothetical protein
MKRPLVGPAGDVFKDCLHSAGIARGECYILNVWESPVVEKSRALYSTEGGPALWTPKGFTEYGLEMAAPTLQRVTSSGANCILALGQQALELCTGKAAGIMKWRGSILKGVERIGERKTVATIHPAATIYGTYMWRYLIIYDMQRALAESKSHELDLPVRDIVIEPTMAEVKSWFKGCMHAKEVATDIEVINHEVSCFSLALTPNDGICIPLTCETGHYWTEDEEIEIWNMYAYLMDNPTIAKVNQNLIGFDSVFLRRKNNIRIRGFLGDTQVAQRLLYPEFNRGLAFIASILTREPYWKDDGKMWKNEGGDFPTFWRYNGKDACVALECWHRQSEELTQRDMWDTYNDRASIYETLLFMTMDGVAVNQEALDETKVEIERQIGEKMRELEGAADYMFNPISPMQCAKYFYGHKGLVPYKNASGGVTSDDKAMSRIYRKTNMREAKLVQEIRGLRKLKGTYLDVVPDADGRLRCSWDPTGTWTGRLSSSQTIDGTGMNFQNVDPRFKRFIVEDFP